MPLSLQFDYFFIIFYNFFFLQCFTVTSSSKCFVNIVILTGNIFPSFNYITCIKNHIIINHIIRSPKFLRLKNINEKKDWTQTELKKGRFLFLGTLQIR